MNLLDEFSIKQAGSDTFRYCMLCITGLVLMNVIMIGMFKSFGIIYVELHVIIVCCVFQDWF